MNNMNAIRWVFFDIGSTLVDEEEAYHHRIRDMIQGTAVTFEQFSEKRIQYAKAGYKERTYVRYVNGQKIKHTVTPVLGEKAPHNGKVVYSLDFQVTPHQLRHTYITNLIYAGVDPKTVQYLAGHENSKITMDIYAKVKYNSPDALSTIVNNAFNNMYAKAE